jgi:hypothetical protein
MTLPTLSLTAPGFRRPLRPMDFVYSLHEVESLSPLLAPGGHCDQPESVPQNSAEQTCLSRILPKQTLKQKSAEVNTRAEPLPQNSAKADTRAELAKVAGVSHDMIADEAAELESKLAMKERAAKGGHAKAGTCLPDAVADKQPKDTRAKAAKAARVSERPAAPRTRRRRAGIEWDVPRPKGPPARP